MKRLAFLEGQIAEMPKAYDTWYKMIRKNIVATFPLFESIVQLEGLAGAMPKFPDPEEPEETNEALWATYGALRTNQLKTMDTPRL